MLIHSSGDGHSGCFHILTVVNNAVVNMGVQITLQCPSFSFSANIPEVALLGHVVILC